MKIFEFQFNPRRRKDKFFKTFSFQKKEYPALGTLIIVGELSNALPFQEKFLNTLGEIVKNEYYALHQKEQKISPQTQLKKALQKLNIYLAKEIKEGNLEWVGNLHLAVLAFWERTPTGPTICSLGKCGNIKILFARRGQIIDIERKIQEHKHLLVHPVNIFGNILSGNLENEDKIIICTQELFDVLISQDILGDLAFLKEERQFKTLFHAKEKALLKVSGILFSILIVKESPKIDLRLISLQNKILRFFRQPISITPLFLNILYKSPLLRIWVIFKILVQKISLLFHLFSFKRKVPPPMIPFLLLGILLLIGFLLFR